MRTPPQLSRTRSGGFTLIELVIVLIIIGVLAAVAAPRFIDFTDEAEEAAVRSQANNLTSANTINAAACRLGKDECESVGDCTQADAELLVEGDLSDFTFGGTAPTADWDTGSCTISQGAYTFNYQLTQTP